MCKTKDSDPDQKVGLKGESKRGGGGDKGENGRVENRVGKKERQGCYQTQGRKM